jgi:hypothetical protein
VRRGSEKRQKGDPRPRLPAVPVAASEECVELALRCAAFVEQ